MSIVLYLEHGHLNQAILELFLSFPEQAHWCINIILLARLSVCCAQRAQIHYVHQVWMFQCSIWVTSQKLPGEIDFKLL